ncbi:MAG: HypC/HybG/HupF family hydrogenase formation chaperone [Candidatus Tectomicrobia bacterium]|nr:HypC/HybG/HupF family hydrogenase formation chaperone [Candidatus Tectomicrobia bacterium]
MCLGIPGQIVDIFEEHGIPMGKVDFGGIKRQICLAYVPESEVGNYVLVHVGFGISLIDEEEAHRTYQLLQEMGQLDELENMEMDP